MAENKYNEVKYITHKEIVIGPFKFKAVYDEGNGFDHVVLINGNTSVKIDSADFEDFYHYLKSDE